MKKQLRILLSVMIMLCLVFTAFACEEGSDNGGTTPAEETYEITVINGTIADKGYNHDVVAKGAQVTVVANEASSSEEAFSHWEVGGEKVSEETSYQVTVNADTTVTAVYGSNYSVWDGEYPEQAPETFVEDEETKTFHIRSAEALAYWGSMITNSSEGTDKTAWKYSTFNWGNYVRLTNNQTLTDELVADAVRQSYVPENQWTVSIECNIDLAGYPWTPVNDLGYAMNDFVIEGNGHIIKNLYNLAFNSGEYFPQSMKSGGFFGNITGTNLTIQNLTFDSAVTEVENTNYNYQNLSIVIGYAHGGERNTYFKHDYPELTYQMTVFDNVNVINSKIVGSTLSRKNGMLIGRLGTAGENYNEKQHCIIKNCTLSNNTIIACDYMGAMIGHIYSNDADITVRDQHKLDIFNNIVTNFTAVSSYNGSDTNHGYAAATVGVWNMYHTFDTETNSAVSPTSSFANVYCDMGNDTITTIDLHVGFGVQNSYSPVNTNRAMLNLTLQARDDSGYIVKDVFIAADIAYSADDLDFLDWAPNDEQVIYLVLGAKVEGLDLGENVRCIPGTRNADGDLIVTDLEGNVIGAWVITDYAGTFVAAE